MIHPHGFMGIDVDLTYEQPLPWNAAEVHIRFYDGPTYTGRVCRYPGDLLSLESDGLTVPGGTPADIQWTQDERGCYAAGVVADPPAGAAPGVFLRIDESATGVERRLGVRLPTQVPVSVVSGFGRVFPGCTANLSLGGARVLLDRPRSGEDLRQALTLAGLGEETYATAVLTLPAGIVSLTSLVIITGRIPGEARLRFVHDSGLAIEQIGALLRAEQRRLTLRLQSAVAAAVPREIGGHRV
jgi:hypothetical protein